MDAFNCCCRCRCPLIAVIASLVTGVIAAFLQIVGVITVTPVFLFVALGVAGVFLAVLLLGDGAARCGCACPDLTAVLAGIIGTVLFSLILLVVGITATSVLSAILVGVLVFFLALIVTAAVCLIRCKANCDN